MNDRIPATDKRLAQHWLFDEASLRSIVAEASLEPDDTVLEIGPGPGSLTTVLLSKVTAVYAVEIDSRLATELLDKIGSDDRLRVINCDIRRYDLNNLPAGYRVVANIPYHISGQIVRLLLESANPPRSLTLLLQKEVAERIAAPPGRLSVLAVASQLWGRVNLGPIIRADKFIPPPKVDSRVVTIIRSLNPDDYKNLRHCLRVVKIGFANRRKTLENALASGLMTTKEKIRPILIKCDIRPDCRAQDVDVAKWPILSQELIRSGLSTTPRPQ